MKRARWWPLLVKLVADLALWGGATLLAFMSRFDWRIPSYLDRTAWLVTGALLLVKLAAILGFRLHQQTWRRIAFRDLTTVLEAVATVALVFSALVFFAGDAIFVPRSIPILDALFAAGLLVSARALARFTFERRLGSRVSPEGRKRVLIVGAGEAGSLVVRELLRHPETGMQPIGFIDDDPQKAARRIAGVPVLGGTESLTAVLAEQPVDEVLIAIPSADGSVIRHIVHQTLGANPRVKHRIMPGMYELLGGEVSIDRIRDVQVEDLLRRPPVKLDAPSIAGYIEGRTVLVTGAGGSIGSELVRQICRFHPGRLLLLGRGENSIFTLERELERDWPGVAYRSVIADVRDRLRLAQVFEAFGPQVVFHAAAHKHVPLMELNPGEAVLNNVLGTRNLAELSLAHGVSHFVNISTDKAVNPTSVMGASKRTAELVVQGVAQRAAPDRLFTSVRFGNVLGSRGSVIPLFKQQIRDGGPVTVTHPEMRRYFMTIPEAAQLVLQAASQGANGEVYILDMGEPVRIVDLARDLIKLSGFEPEVDIPIVFSGTRPGEKLYEELMTDAEREAATAHRKIFVARRPLLDPDALEAALEALEQAARRADGGDIRRIFNELIEGSACRAPSN